MTSQHFEEYLVSIGGLINGNYPDRDPIVTNICECADGWLQLIHDLIEELIALGWDKHVCQIKEKFGILRFYPGSCTDEQWKVIEEYEKKSSTICEVCGEPGETDWGNPWVRTLCENRHGKN